MICVNCGTDYNDNERDRPSNFSYCPDCFITHLKNKVAYLEKHLKLAKRILTIKLIRRQEAINAEDAKIMKMRGGGYSV